MKILNLILILTFFFSCCDTTSNGKGKTEQELQTIWQYGYELAGYPEAPPLMVEETLYMIGDIFLTALEPETRDLKWRTQADSERALRGQKILHVDNQIVVAHYEIIKAWDKVTGKKLWEFIYTEELKPRLNGNICSTSDGFAYSALKGKFFIFVWDISM